MTVRCTVCVDDFKVWSDRDEVCPVCKTLIAGERQQAEEPAAQERKPKKRPVQCRKKTNAGSDGFAAYDEAAAREAKKAGKWLSYGEFTARKYAEQKKTVIGGKSDDC